MVQHFNRKNPRSQRSGTAFLSKQTATKPSFLFSMLCPVSDLNTTKSALPVNLSARSAVAYLSSLTSPRCGPNAFRPRNASALNTFKRRPSVATRNNQQEKQRTAHCSNRSGNQHTTPRFNSITSLAE
ncbi:hypothetical protein TRVL_01836 [Trypanosoma vivax]|nr:hypothetical protein TRVL_01836 [Trypanosoma vivax]